MDATDRGDRASAAQQCQMTGRGLSVVVAPTIVAPSSLIELATVPGLPGGCGSFSALPSGVTLAGSRVSSPAVTDQPDGVPSAMSYGAPSSTFLSPLPRSQRTPALRFAPTTLTHPYT